MQLDVGDPDGHLGTLADLIARYQHEGLLQRSERVTGRARCGERRRRRMATPSAVIFAPGPRSRSAGRSHCPAVSVHAERRCGPHGRVGRISSSSPFDMVRVRDGGSVRDRRQARPLRGLHVVRALERLSRYRGGVKRRSSFTDDLAQLVLACASLGDNGASLTALPKPPRSARAVLPVASAFDATRRAPRSAEAPREVCPISSTEAASAQCIIERKYDRMTPGRGPAAPDRVLGPVALRVDRPECLISACLESDGKIDASASASSDRGQAGSGPPM
jgi:hypothetical protein